MCGQVYASNVTILSAIGVPLYFRDDMIMASNDSKVKTQCLYMAMLT